MAPTHLSLYDVSRSLSPKIAPHRHEHHTTSVSVKIVNGDRECSTIRILYHSYNSHDTFVCLLYTNDKGDSANTHYIIIFDYFSPHLRWLIYSRHKISCVYKELRREIGSCLRKHSIPSLPLSRLHFPSRSPIHTRFPVKITIYIPNAFGKSEVGISGKTYQDICDVREPCLQRLLWGGQQSGEDAEATVTLDSFCFCRC